MDTPNIGAAEPDDDGTFDEIIQHLDIDTMPTEQDVLAERPSTSPAPAPSTDDHAQPASTPAEPTSVPTTLPGPTALLPELETPPELVVPPEPEAKTSSVVKWWSNAFPHLVWLSVVAGLVGQVYGWTRTFGGGPVAIAVAITLGGTFEFIMVAASSRGLRDIGRNRPPWQAAVFILAGTACAGLAFWMNLHHFTGELALAGVAAAAATAIGYLAHVAVHFFDELDNRRELAAWQEERDRVLAQIRRREEKARADYDEYQAHVRKAHTRELTVTRQVEAAAPPAEPVPDRTPGSRPTTKPKSTARKLDRDTACTWSRTNGNPGPAAVREHFQHQGYDVPAISTLRRWINSGDAPTD